MTVFGDYDKTRQKFFVRGIAGRVEPIGRYDEMEVHYGDGTRNPRIGETLSVWVDVNTPYAMAPKDDA